MKKNLAFLLLLLFCFSMFFSCEKKNTSTTTTSSSSTSSSNHTSTQPLFTTSTTNDEEETWYLVEETWISSQSITYKYYYNIDYMLVKYEIFSDGILNSTVEIEYDENGYKNYEKSQSEFGFVMEVYYTNYANGRVLEQRSLINGGNESITLFEYTDTNGSYVKTHEASGSTETVTVDTHGNVTKEEDNFGTTTIYENTYNGNLLIETKATRTESTYTTITTIEYEYDAYGNLIATTTLDEDGTVSQTITYTYAKNVVFVD